MNKLAVCLLCLLLVLGIAKLRGGVAVMTPSVVAERSAAAALGQFGIENTVAIRSVAPMLKPGAYVVSRLGIDPAARAGLALTLLICWWCWVTLTRLSVIIPGRAFGLINLGMFQWWIAIAVPWRFPYGLWLRVKRWSKQFRYGPRATANWAGVLAAMLLTFRPGKSVYIGRVWAYGIGLQQPIGIAGDRHITVVAASGAGKTRWLMAELGMIHRRASALVIDVDGQIVNSLGPSLVRNGHHVYNLDPYGLTRFPGACWNALDEITSAVKRHGRKAAVRFAQTLAEALVQEGNRHQPIFSESARIFVHGVILYVWLFELEEKRNLVRVRELLTRGLTELVLDAKQDAFDVLLSVMNGAVEYDDGCGGEIVAVIARAAGVMKAGKTRDGDPFRSTAISSTSWLDLPEIAAISKRSDFVTEDLKTSNPCVFVCLPVTDIQTKLAGFVRALAMMGLYTFQNIPGRLKIPCTFALDEFPSLGRIEILETAAPVFRKYGVRLILITQDLERLRQAYPHSWGGFIGNSMATLWMSTNHQETLEYLSRILGVATYIEEISANGSARVERRERPLMSPDQLREFLDTERRQFIVSRDGKPPLRVVFEGYDKALSIFDYDRDLNFREPNLRAATRWITSTIAKAA